MRTIVLAAVLAAAPAGCGGAAPGGASGEGQPTSAAPAATGYGDVSVPEKLPGTAPAWLVGRWRTTDGRTTEHWTAARGRLWGVALNLAQAGEVAFEIMVAEELGPSWVFFAMPGGADPTLFPETARAAERITFARGGQDFPATIVYGRAGDRLTASLTGGGPELELVYAVDDAAAPGELATVDAALGTALEAGSEATFALLHDDVALTGGARSARGRADAEAALARLIAAPERLRLRAVTGGLGPDGQTGYVLGEYGHLGGAEHGVYVAIWIKTAASWTLRHLHLGPPTPGG